VSRRLDGIKLRSGFTQVLERRKEVLGEEHADNLIRVYWLACLLQYQRQYEDALVLFGPDHPTTQTCFDNYTSVQRPVNEQASVNDRPKFLDAVPERMHAGPQGSNITELASRPKDRW